MEEIKFNNDYSKLPLNWEGTQAVLIGIAFCNSIEKLKKSMPQFVRHDTSIRNKKPYSTEFYPINFEAGIILSFVHINSGIPFTTIRKYTIEKLKKYQSMKWETFKMVRK